MIDLDFSVGIAVYFLAFLAFMLAAWFLNREEKGKDLSLDPKIIWFCSVCTYNYIDTRQESISVCPRCGSYNKK
jgi:rubrerythrin